jgi:hypothetical protein
MMFPKLQSVDEERHPSELHILREASLTSRAAGPPSWAVG